MKLGIILLLLIISITSCSKSIEDTNMNQENNIQEKQSNQEGNNNPSGTSIIINDNNNEFIDLNVIKNQSIKHSNTFIEIDEDVIGSNNNFTNIDISKTIEDPKFDIDIDKKMMNNPQSQNVKSSFN